MYNVKLTIDGLHGYSFQYHSGTPDHTLREQTFFIVLGTSDGVEGGRRPRQSGLALIIGWHRLLETYDFLDFYYST